MSDSTTAFPGEKIASIEEYEAGYNTFDDGDMVRAATVGRKILTRCHELPYQASKVIVNSSSGRRHNWDSCSSNVIYDCSFN